MSLADAEREAWRAEAIKYGGVPDANGSPAERQLAYTSNRLVRVLDILADREANARAEVEAVKARMRGLADGLSTGIDQTGYGQGLKFAVEEIGAALDAADKQVAP